MMDDSNILSAGGVFRFGNGFDFVKVLDNETALSLNNHHDTVSSFDSAKRQMFLKELRNPLYKDQIRSNNILLSKKMIAESVNTDTMIIQTINAIGDLDRICNVLTKRLREWYGYHLPELEHSIDDNEIFARRIIQKSREEFMEDLNIQVSMGAGFCDTDRNAMMDFARQIGDLFIERQKLIDYLESIMRQHCPNILDITGALIAAKLIEKAKSLCGLAMMTSSTIQMLGAEKALFRHLRNKKIRAPKHGYILSHPFVMGSKERGKAARILSAKISIAAKVDYFKGEYIADKLNKELN